MKLRAKAYLRIAAEDWREKYDLVGGFCEGFFAVRLNGKWGFIDHQGNEVITPKYDSVRDFSDGFAAVKRNHMWGFVDKTGNEVIPPKYDYVGYFHDGFSRVKLNGKKGWVTREGKELLLDEDQHIQVINLLALGKITEKQLFNWINKRAV